MRKLSYTQYVGECIAAGKRRWKTPFLIKGFPSTLDPADRASVLGPLRARATWWSSLFLNKTERSARCLYGQYRGIIGGCSYNFTILKRYVNPSDKTGYHVYLRTLLLMLSSSACILPTQPLGMGTSWSWKETWVFLTDKAQARHTILKTIRIVEYFPNQGQYKVRAFPMSPFHSSDWSALHKWDWSHLPTWKARYPAWNNKRQRISGKHFQRGRYPTVNRRCGWSLQSYTECLWVLFLYRMVE